MMAISSQMSENLNALRATLSETQQAVAVKVGSDDLEQLRDELQDSIRAMAANAEAIAAADAEKAAADRKANAAAMAGAMSGAGGEGEVRALAHRQPCAVQLTKRKQIRTGLDRTGLDCTVLHFTGAVLCCTVI